MFAAKLIKFWLEYKNDWLTVSAYAEYHGMSEFDTTDCIEIGRKYEHMYKWHLDAKGEVVITGLA